MKDIHIETERLILRKMILADAESLLEMESDPEVLKFIGTPVLQNVGEVEKMIKFVQSQYEKNGVGRFSVVLKETNEVIGWSGLKLEDAIRDFEYYDLGYRFKRKHWGRGYATESGVASLDYVFDDMGLSEVFAATYFEHNTSQNVLSKLGLNYIEDFYFEEKRCKWFGINKKDWKAKFVSF